MGKKDLAIFIGAGATSIILIIVTVIIALAIGKVSPVNIVTTELTNKLGYNLLKNYSNMEDSEIEKYISKKPLDDAYLSLLEDETDIVLVTEINKEVIDFIHSNSIEFEKYIIGKDGLVILNNKLNPVENITTTQLNRIYSADVTNWNEVGGEDKNITAYYSDEESEETHMLNVFLGDKFQAEPRYRTLDNSFESLINALSKYLDTRKGALGYTTYYNIKNNELNEDIRILNLDGIEPSGTSISSGRYPATINIYAIVRKDKLNNSDINKMISYILSQEGQNIIDESGYIKK